MEKRTQTNCLSVLQGSTCFPVAGKACWFGQSFNFKKNGFDSSPHMGLPFCPRVLNLHNHLPQKRVAVSHSHIIFYMTRFWDSMFFTYRKAAISVSFVKIMPSKGKSVSQTGHSSLIQILLVFEQPARCHLFPQAPSNVSPSVSAWMISPGITLLPGHLLRAQIPVATPATNSILNIY